jgi:hypothetical protein
MSERRAPYARYSAYVLRHKWFVWLAGWRLGLPWHLGVLHDWSKFLPSEFLPYAKHFYGPHPQRRDATGYYKPTNTGDPAFDVAWLHHSRRNKHHWQYWAQVSPNSVTVTPMPDKYRREMLADWIGAGRAQGKPDTKTWYLANRDKMILHADTTAWIERHLNLTPLETALR